jgi:hypothetical protein
MRKRITLLIAALMLALPMSFGGVAFAGGHGCSKHSQGFKASSAQCHHKGKKATITVTASTITKAGAMSLHFRPFLQV